jgi:Ca-activated chloride channel family protein
VGFARPRGREDPFGSWLVETHVKLRTAALGAILAASSSVLGAVIAPLPSPAIASATPEDPTQPGGGGAVDKSHFAAGQTVHLDARLGHATMAKGGNGETYLFASVSGADAPQAAPPLNLAIVVDKSGSMKGERIARAIDAGVGIVERMRDGDTITVVDFDTSAEVVTAPTRLTGSNRASVETAIRGIRLGGDTCISCGLETAAAQLRSVSIAGDHVTRIMLLSDGATNHGVTDMGGLRGIAGRMRDRGCAITTIGVDVDFDEKVMAALATESNGRHYFVASAAGLPAIFAQEFDSLVASVAQDTDMIVDLAPGVEVDQVFDRTFRRENGPSGARIIVPFGVLAAKQEKTALVKLRVPTDHDGKTPVAKVAVAYRDLLARADKRDEGELQLFVKSDGSAQADLDPFVAARVERSRTAQSLTLANDLFKDGKFEEAERTLATRATELHASASRRPMALAKPDSERLGADFDKQIGAVAEAQTNFAPMATASAARGGGSVAAAPPTHIEREQVRKNQQAASDFSF